MLISNEPVDQSRTVGLLKLAGSMKAYMQSFPHACIETWKGLATSSVAFICLDMYSAGSDNNPDTFKIRVWVTQDVRAALATYHTLAH
jgi:hypothetical protein